MINSKKALKNFVNYTKWYIFVMMNKKSTYSKSDKTRQYIIEKVAPIFNKKGYAATSLADLTEATGLTKGAIYGNFKSKNEIAIEAFKYNLLVASGSVNTEVALANTSLEKLRVLIMAFRKAYPKAMEIGGCPILNTVIDSDNNDNVLRQLSTKAVEGLKNTISQAIKTGIAVGEIKSNTDGDTVGGLLVTLIEGGFFMAKSTGEVKYFINALTHCEQIIDNIVK